MAETKTKSGRSRVRAAPPRTLTEQENLMISLSMKQAEDMLREGRAPAAVVVHFLKLATESTKAQNRKLNADAEMATAKAEYVRMQQKHEQDYNRVVEAFKGYGGNSGVLNGHDEDNEDIQLGIGAFDENWFRTRV